MTNVTAPMTFTGDQEVVNGVLNTLAEVTTYEVEQIKPNMTLVGYMQLDPESDIPMLVKKINKMFEIYLDAADIADQDPTVEDLIDLISSEIDLA